MPNIGEFEDFFANVKLLMFRNWRVDNSKKRKGWAGNLWIFTKALQRLSNGVFKFTNNAGVNSLKKNEILCNRL